MMQDFFCRPCNLLSSYGYGTVSQVMAILSRIYMNTATKFDQTRFPHMGTMQGIQGSCKGSRDIKSAYRDYVGNSCVMCRICRVLKGAHGRSMRGLSFTHILQVDQGVLLACSQTLQYGKSLHAHMSYSLKS